jgi:hypothetical protein
VATTTASDGGLRRRRRSRPFWGGLLLLIAGLGLFLSADLTLGDLEVPMGPEGFLSCSAEPSSSPWSPWR